MIRDTPDSRRPRFAHRTLSSGRDPAHARGVRFSFSLSAKVISEGTGSNFAPHRVNTILVPTMASRLMLSLKKAAAGPRTPWSLSTMTNSNRGATSDLVTIHFASRTPSAPQEIPESLAPLDEGDDIELGPVALDRR